MSDSKEFAILDQAATMLEAGQSETAGDMLSAAMREVAKHYPQSGLKARERWIASLTALGETCLTIAKRERQMFL